MMRNEWFPRKVAEYVTMDKLLELGVKKDTPLERDSTFMSSVARRAEKERIKKDKEELEEQQAIEAAKVADAEALRIREAEEAAAAELRFQKGPVPNEELVRSLDVSLPVKLEPNWKSLLSNHSPKKLPGSSKTYSQLPWTSIAHLLPLQLQRRYHRHYRPPL
jgi:hypothetical protein